MNDVLPHFALQNEAKRRSFKITFGGVSRQMTCQGLFTQPHKIFQNADFVGFASQNQQNRRFEKVFFGGSSRKTFRKALFKTFFRRRRRRNTFHSIPKKTHEAESFNPLPPHGSYPSVSAEYRQKLG